MDRAAVAQADPRIRRVLDEPWRLRRQVGQGSGLARGQGRVPVRDGRVPEPTDVLRGVMARVAVHLPESARIVGTFMCQGRMPASVRARYAQTAEAKPEQAARMHQLIGTSTKRRAIPMTMISRVCAKLSSGELAWRSRRAFRHRLPCRVAAVRCEAS